MTTTIKLTDLEAKAKDAALVETSADVDDGSDAIALAGNCFDTAERLADKLADDGITAETREVAVGEYRQAHFVVAVPCADVEGVEDDGHVLVDPTIRQFSKAVKEADPETHVSFGPVRYVPSVGVFPPGEEERLVWYYRPNDPPKETGDVWRP